MKAITVSAYGERPTLTEQDKPTAGPGHILIRVQAAGINPMDSTIAAGGWASRMPATFPLTLGVDVAGIVEAVGDDASAFAAGDAVFGQLLIAPLGSSGTYAEYVRAPLDASLAAIPPTVTGVTAASLPTPAGTALDIIDHLGDLAGKTVLVVGAAGAVGSAVTQFVVNAGAAVSTVASESDAARLAGYGASGNVDRAAGPVAPASRALRPDGFDVLIDLASDAAPFAELATTVLRAGGIALTTRFVADLGALDDAGLHGINFGTTITPTLLGRVANAVVSGVLVPPPVTTVALSDVPAFLTDPHGRRGGKAVVVAGS